MKILIECERNLENGLYYGSLRFIENNAKYTISCCGEDEELICKDMLGKYFYEIESIKQHKKEAEEY